MAAEVVGHLKPGMLCLADRMYSSSRCGRRPLAPEPICSQEHAANGMLLPVASSMALTFREFHPSSRRAAARRTASWCVLSEYELENVEDAEPVYRLITTLLGSRRLPQRNSRPSIPSAGKSKECLMNSKHTHAADCPAQQDPGTHRTGVLRLDARPSSRAHSDERGCRYQTVHFLTHYPSPTP